jgi:hypothetical protein
MPNKAPVAILNISDTEITLPQNKIVLDSSQSYDPNRRGSISHREYYQAAGKGTVSFTEINDLRGTCTAAFPALAGIYTLGVKVFDNRGLMNEVPEEVRLIVSPAPFVTCFGASGPTIDSTENLQSLCGSPSVSRFALFLEKGDTFSRQADPYLTAGHTVFLNINEKTVKKDAAGNKIPNPFPTDLNKYANQVTKVFEAYKNHAYKDKIIMVCENEPTTQAFHSGPMSDYLAMLEVFIDLCEDYGFNGIDGGVHVVTVLGSNSSVGEGKAADVAELLEGYAKIPGMYKVNIHTSNTKTDSFNSADIVSAVNKIYNITGHAATCNEWHIEDKKGVTVQPRVLTDICQGWFDAKVEHSVYITTDPDTVLNNGNSLTKYGQAYKNFIDSHRQPGAQATDVECY